MLGNAWKQTARLPDLGEQQKAAESLEGTELEVEVGSSEQAEC